MLAEKEKMERETGIEPATSSLGSWHSTAELLPLAPAPPKGGAAAPNIVGRLHACKGPTDKPFTEPAAARVEGLQVKTGSANLDSRMDEALCTSACSELPWESMVTMAGRSLTRRCHMASGMPNSSRWTPFTSSMQRE